ncbi:MAG: 3-deoxy-7-phosphoheptulonate synthase class II [Acidobacteria bacterium]|nr:3-deoxy-7-phosphoheptulonate synthase class II [Acidobacteriota bacterium]
MKTAPDWSPDSWRARPRVQQPNYPDESALRAVVDELRQLPPLVSPWEIDALRAQLADAAAGRKFLLQGGDCAERFSDCRADTITNKLKILLQMSLVLVEGAQAPIIRVGRFAGQYAKPRTEDLETRDGVTLPAYRGDLVNAPEFTAAARTPDPRRLRRGYSRGAMTLNYVRALVKGGFADLHHPEYWDLDFVERSPLAEEYQRLVRRIGNSLRFMENILGARPGEIQEVDFYVSHEGLLLDYEEAQTRWLDAAGRWYNLSTHFPWIGMRTSDPSGAHAEYFRGIANPIGLKVGPATSPERLLRLLDVLDPAREPGRMTLIHRFGREHIRAALPPLLAAVRASGRAPLWVCDPMHGNTRPTAEGLKTRAFDDILGELEQAFELHAEASGRLGGVHFELTGDNVTECTGGARGLSEQDLKRAYQSEVDPRLNSEQALEMAMLIARKMTALNAR